MDLKNPRPHAAATEGFRLRQQKLKNLLQLCIPGGECILQILHDPVVVAHCALLADNQVENFFGKGDEHAARHGQHAVGALRCIMRFERESNL